MDLQADRRLNGKKRSIKRKKGIFINDETAACGGAGVHSAHVSFAKLFKRVTSWLGSDLLSNFWVFWLCRFSRVFRLPAYADTRALSWSWVQTFTFSIYIFHFYLLKFYSQTKKKKQTPDNWSKIMNDGVCKSIIILRKTERNFWEWWSTIILDIYACVRTMHIYVTKRINDKNWD